MTLTSSKPATCEMNKKTISGELFVQLFRLVSILEVTPSETEILEAIADLQSMTSVWLGVNPVLPFAIMAPAAQSPIEFTQDEVPPTPGARVRARRKAAQGSVSEVDAPTVAHEAKTEPEVAPEVKSFGVQKDETTVPNSYVATTEAPVSEPVAEVSAPVETPVVEPAAETVAEPVAPAQTEEIPANLKLTTGETYDPTHRPHKAILARVLKGNLGFDFDIKDDAAVASKINNALAGVEFASEQSLEASIYELVKINAPHKIPTAQPSENVFTPPF